jgi:hypothetical protein
MLVLSLVEKVKKKARSTITKATIATSAIVAVFPCPWYLG